MMKVCNRLRTSAMAAPVALCLLDVRFVIGLMLVRHETTQKTEAVWGSVSLRPHTAAASASIILNQSLRAPVVFGTRFAGFFSCSAVNFDPVLGPRGHASLVHSAAAGQTGHLAGEQDSIPQPHLRQLSHQGLGGVEASTQRILRGNKRGGSLWKEGIVSCSNPTTPPVLTDLLLAQYQHSSWSDVVAGCQGVTFAPQLPTLEGLPGSPLLAPAHTDVLPAASGKV